MIIDGNSKVGSAKVYGTAKEMDTAQEIKYLKKYIEDLHKELKNIKIFTQDYFLNTRMSSIDDRNYIYEYIAKECMHKIYEGVMEQELVFKSVKQYLDEERHRFVLNVLNAETAKNIRCLMQCYYMR